MRIFITCFVLAAGFSSSIALGACDKSKSASTPLSRFVLSDGEALDQKSQLIWSRCSVGTTWDKGGKCAGSVKLMRLEAAKQYAQKLGHGWRVPSVEELYSIVEQKCSNPAINPKIFPNVTDLGEGAPYWSITKVKEAPPLIYFINFLSGEADGHTKDFLMAVRLVRSRQ